MVRIGALGLTLACLSENALALRAEQTAPHNSLMAKMRKSKRSSHKRAASPGYAVTRCDSMEFTGATYTGAWNLEVTTEQNDPFTSKLTFDSAGRVSWCVQGSGGAECTHVTDQVLEANWKVTVEFADDGAQWAFTIVSGTNKNAFKVARQSGERYFKPDDNAGATASVVAKAAAACFHHSNDCASVDMVPSASRIQWKFIANFQNVFEDQCIVCSAEEQLKLNAKDYDVSVFFDGESSKFVLLIDGLVHEVQHLQGAPAQLGLSESKVGCDTADTKMQGSLEEVAASGASADNPLWQAYTSDLELAETAAEGIEMTSVEADTTCGEWVTCVENEKPLIGQMCNYDFNSHDSKITVNQGTQASPANQEYGPYDALENFECNDVTGPDCLEQLNDVWIPKMEQMLTALETDWAHCGTIHTQFVDKHEECRDLGDICSEKRCKMGQDLITMLLDFKYKNSWEDVKNKVTSGDISSIDQTEVKFKHKAQHVPTLDYNTQAVPEVTDYSQSDVSSDIKVKFGTTNAFVGLGC